VLGWRCPLVQMAGGCWCASPAFFLASFASGARTNGMGAAAVSAVARSAAVPAFLAREVLS